MQSKNAEVNCSILRQDSAITSVSWEGVESLKLFPALRKTGRARPLQDWSAFCGKTQCFLCLSAQFQSGH
eukprot:12895773-Prorocentrum_lima.AAC.1